MDGIQEHLINDSLKTSKEKSMFRPFTEDTKMLIVMFVNERKLTYGEMAIMLNRDEGDLRNKVKTMQTCGEFHKIHSDLMDYEGLYTLKSQELI